jgi:signal transduction histidine kinase
MTAAAAIDKPSVLIVDDDPAVLEALADELSETYIVTQASDGESALQILESKKFDIIISDVRMPGIDGVEVVRRARLLDDGMVRILLTGYADQNALAAALSPDGVFKLNKPWGDELEIILRRALEHRQQLAREEKRAQAEREARERVELSVTRLDKLALLGTLTSSVAHEMRSPLSYLSANFEWLIRSLPRLSVHLGLDAEEVIGRAPPDSDSRSATEVVGEMVKVFEECEHGIQRMTDIVESLRVYSSPGQRRTARVDMPQCVKRAVKMIEAKYKRDVVIRTSVEDSVAPVRGHEGEIGQIVINLLINGIQAMAGSGTIDVRLRSLSDVVEVEVEDCGPGVPAELQDRVFEVFFTTKGEADGTGLGLAISRDIARRHDGDLVLAESPVGARFILRLPVMGDA